MYKRQFAGCPAENLRPWMAGGYQAAFAGTLCLKIVFGDLLAELPDQIILQGSLLVGGVKISAGVGGPLERNKYT